MQAYKCMLARTCCSRIHLDLSLSESKLSKEGRDAMAAATSSGCRPGNALKAAALLASVEGFLFSKEGFLRNMRPT